MRELSPVSALLGKPEHSPQIFEGPKDSGVPEKPLAMKTKE
jgi:hypothetical protein